MKTGKLLKFQRLGVDIQAYFYREDDQVRACLYVLAGDAPDQEPAHVIAGATEDRVEAEVRAWIESHYPRAR
jgi:hypothetical protein